MTDETERQILALEQANPLREPVLRAAIAALPFASGSRGLDIGCGIGQQALLLAEATHPGGEVVGLDISPKLLAYAAQCVKDSPYAERISFREGDMSRLPFADNTFDWVWSADCAGYPAGDLLPVLREIARVLRPGGVVALLGWSSQQLLYQGTPCLRPVSMPPRPSTRRSCKTRPRRPISCGRCLGFPRPDSGRVPPAHSLARCRCRWHQMFARP